MEDKLLVSVREGRINGHNRRVDKSKAQQNAEQLGRERRH
jgi:hypothetical protein